ncbi:hypothetical protein [Companilactobacillus halodurans]|uniref:Uncharacterized protein n=1 Tax=Companilactobacillus halodurans TaxID=2584183 RepID=A0A5P0ZZL4_9LACO|nr:hypothetical protein [Companilactobacillus halodurans]MQS98325.1 hypothetical protein [Companilactobacillus halodurans]
MALTRTKTIYINGTSKDGDRILGNFNASLSENGQMSINETVSESTNLDTVEADFNEFRELAKNELKKFNGQDTETNVSSDESGDKEVAATTSDNKPAGAITKADDKPETDVSNDKSVDKAVATTSDNEVVKDNKPVDAIAKADDKPETDVPDETKTSDVKDSEEPKQPISSEEVKKPASSEEVKQPVSNEETKQPSSPVSPVSPVASEETKQPVVNEETKQPAESEEIKQPASSEEVKVSDVKDGENADESNQLRHQ